MITLNPEIVGRWTSQLAEFRKLRALVDGAALVEEFLADLAKITIADDGKAVSIAQAAMLSGYSEDHLRRLVRANKLTNVGRKHSPRVLTGELPKRAGRSLAAKTDKSYNPASDARSLRSRR